ncbi:nitrate reductase molybdenum cofactor assembly chaperone [Inhella sp.]|uniref:nitrate reductase molybdenum cofactor assembly chaperone n=1 Tax=Inhella sp. TaxID=1921806 RepID=UPI0035B34A94
MNDSKPNQPIAYTLRVLSALLRYPDAAFRAAVPEMQEALDREAALHLDRVLELHALLRRLQQDDPFNTEAEFVEMFDRGRSTSLHLFEHVHGDSRDRGQAMVDLTQTYERAGLLLDTSELPDHLPVVLEYASTQPPQAAREFLAEFAHILRGIFSALRRRNSGYASVLAALLELAGEQAEAVELPPEPALDDSWAEPEPFSGCSSPGQSRPADVQPVHIIRKQPSTASGASA